MSRRWYLQKGVIFETEWVWGFFCTHVDGYILVINKTTHASELIFFFGNGMQEAFGYQKKLIRWVILAITSVCNDSFTS